MCVSFSFCADIDMATLRPQILPQYGIPGRPGTAHDLLLFPSLIPSMLPLHVETAAIARPVNGRQLGLHVVAHQIAHGLRLHSVAGTPCFLPQRQKIPSIQLVVRDM
jgi:hypothetical protein